MKTARIVEWHPPMNMTCLDASGYAELGQESEWRSHLPTSPGSGQWKQTGRNWKVHHVSNSVLQQSREDCIIYMPPGKRHPNIMKCINMTQPLVTNASSKIKH